jgi:chromosome segregation ATPase
LQDLISDFEVVKSRLEALKSRAENDVNYLAARLASKELQRAQEQSNQLTLLNYIVFILGLLSTMASVLALQKPRKYTIAFVVALGLALLAIVLSRGMALIRPILQKIGVRVWARWKRPSERGEDPFDFV